MADVEQRFFTDDGHGDGYLYPQDEEGEPVDFFSKALIPLAQDELRRKSVTRKEHRDKVDELFKLAEHDCALPLWRFQESGPARELQRLEDPRWFLVATMFPNLATIYNQSHRAALQADATRTAVAVQIYHLRNGTWPESLDKLVPECIAEIPVDRFDGQPLRYKLIDGEPCIYSVYVDKTDDGGKPNPETNPNATLADLIDDSMLGKGDLILWPELQQDPDSNPNEEASSEDSPTSEPSVSDGGPMPSDNPIND